MEISLNSFSVPPKWIVEPQDIALLENYPASIPCQVHGMPTPIVRWFRIEGELQNPFPPKRGGRGIHFLFLFLLRSRASDVILDIF
jgi:hypothetical protein